MSNTLRNSLVILVVIIAAAALVLVGMYFGRAWSSPMGFFPGSMMGGSLTHNNAQLLHGMGHGLMGSYDQPGAYSHHGPHMMGQGMMDQGMAGQGMMGQGMIGPGMMGTYGNSTAFEGEPLSLAETEAALESYIEALGADDLALGEIMIFDNHAYAQFIEAGTGIGAMEVLVDPVTLTVSPEFGPNMMWNLKYSPMASSGMMGMMSGFGFSVEADDMGGLMNDQVAPDLPTEMPITPDKAIQTAQVYLDAYLTGAEADEKADPFYGYYTIHINIDGSTVGMLSVNGYTGEVFVHTWHGDLVEMSEDH